MEPKYECVDHLRSAVRPDADGHTGFDFAQPDRTDLPVHDDPVPIESVTLKLFIGIEKFEIMAIPFFILTGNFLTHAAWPGA
jgi:hypothetical protein